MSYIEVTRMGSCTDQEVLHKSIISDLKVLVVLLMKLWTSLAFY